MSMNQQIRCYMDHMQGYYINASIAESYPYIQMMRSITHTEHGEQMMIKLRGEQAMFKLRKGLYKEGDVGIVQLANTDWRIINFHYQVMVRQRFRTLRAAKRYYAQKMTTYSWYTMDCKKLLIRFEEMETNKDYSYIMKQIEFLKAEEYSYVKEFNRSSGDRLSVRMKVNWSN